MNYYADTTRIPCPAGTLLLFDAILPHGTKPNRSKNNRMIQFLRYEKKSNFSKNYAMRSKAVLKKCHEIGYKPNEYELTVL
jgi:hypothetical protein